MALSPEWKSRVESWLFELKNQFYTPIVPVRWQKHTTYDYLSLEQALERDFEPAAEGESWGGEWEYGWFKSRVVLPEEAAGERIVLDVELGGEATLFVDGGCFGARRADRMIEKHHYLCDQTVAMRGEPGRAYELLVECYAGHDFFTQGPGYVATGPVPPGRYVKADPQKPRRTVGRSTIGVWNEAAYQLYLDVNALYEIAHNVDADSLRAAEIEEALRDFTVIVDFEQDAAGMRRSFEAARERLRPLLKCVNGSTSPEMYLFGHAHIDVAWLWPLAETERKCARTFAAQLRLMDEYPQYVFLQSQPYLYALTKKNYPELYEKIREKIGEGRFIPEGGMWLEADTNITGGEGLIRQFVHGKRFFREEFGVESELLWLPDVFGYSAALPQILKGCGIKYFSTQKIFWTYNGGEPFPYHYFWWQGLDGSEIASFIHMDYNSYTDPATLIGRWKDRVQKEGFKSFLVPFGYGDGGGGPARDHVEYALREGDLEGVPKAKLAGPVRFFEDMAKAGGPPKRYVGELYFQAHRGTYTSQARTKKLNRKAEFALREAEMWGTAAKALAGYAYPADTMDAAWKTALSNQFHDILPGSSIARVYAEANADYEKVIAAANGAAAEAAKALASGGEGLTVFNSLSWGRKALVELPEGWAGAVDKNGNVLSVQKHAQRSFAETDVPACGWTSLQPSAAFSDAVSGASASGRTLENEHLKVRFNEFGEIISIWDKDAGRELAAGPCNSLELYKDVPAHFDAWDIDSTYERMPVELADKAELEVISSGPLKAAIKITRKINDSALTQVASLRRGSRRVDFETDVDWRERHKLLKVAFAVDYHAEEAVHEIQFGHVRRPNHRSRKYDADRFEVCNHKWTALMEENRGFAVLNDCKYGVNVLGNRIALTLLRAPTAPDFDADRGAQSFAYAFYAWNGPFADSGVVEEAYDLNVPVLTAAGCAGERSLLSVSAPNVAVEAVKPAEDGSGDIVIRLYESKRSAVRCEIAAGLPFREAWEADMLERPVRRIASSGGAIGLSFRPFEIKTLLLKS
jgi:alpha-mannosidase